MKSLSVGCLFFLFFLQIQFGLAQNVGINTSGLSPNTAALLDIDANPNFNKGLLIPRVTFSQRTGVNFNPLSAAAQGLTVYQTDAGGLGEGFYYNTSTSTTPAWSFLLNNNSGWSLTGNAATTPSSSAIGTAIATGQNYIGTSDLKDFVIATNNLERLRINSAGNIGIGTLSPTSTALLTINPTTNALRDAIDITMTGATSTATGLNISAGSSSVNGISVANSSSSQSSSFYGIGAVLSSTNIVSGYNAYRNSSGLSYGIYAINGTNASYATNANTWAAFLQGRTVISSESSPSSGLGTDLEIRNTSTGSSPATLSMRQSTSNTTSGNVLANINFGDNHQTTPQAQIQVARDASGGTGDLPSNMIFSTTPDATTTLIERMRITNNGNVGIGTTSPNSKLSIVNSAIQGIQLDGYGISGHGIKQRWLGGTSASPSSPATGNEINILEFYTGGTNAAYFGNPSVKMTAQIGSPIGSVLSSVDWHFYTNSTASGTPFKAMTIQGQTGNVGIGTTSPGEKLTVAAGATDATFFDGVNIKYRYLPDPANLYRYWMIGNVAGVGMSVGSSPALMFTNGDTYLRSLIVNQDGLSFFTNGTTNANAIERMRITAAGNIGIGTTAPSTQLHTTGSVRFQTLTGTGNRFVITDLNGNISAGAATTAGIIAGSGTLNYVPKWTPDGNTLGNSLIFDNGTNVGIGTNTPAAKLEVIGTSARVSNSGDAKFEFFGSSADRGFVGWQSTAPVGVYLLNKDNSPIMFGTTNAERMRIDAAGNVGIGTTVPNAPLTLGSAVTTNLSPELSVNSTGNKPLFVGQTNGNLGLMIGYDGNDIQGRTGASFATNGDLTLNKYGGNVGIGTSTPAKTVSIGQNIAANNTDYAIEILRHGTLASPGTYSASSPAIIINDISGDGPTSLEAQGLLQINASRIADADPNAANALLLNVSNDNGSALAVNAKRNIGIGTTSPSTQLHTTGSVRFQTLTGTGNRFVITDLNGNISAGAATTAGIITGSGTLNYVPKWTPDGATLGNSLIFDNGTNVGIGTNTPAAKLEVIGTSARVSNSGDAKFEFFGSSADRGFVGWQSTAPVGVYLLNKDNSPIMFGTTNAERMRIDAAGNVGIGTTVPNAPLTLGSAVTTNLSPELSVNSTGNKPLFVGQTNGNLGLMIGYDGNDIQGRTGASFATNGDLTLNKYGGNVGIGTSTPAKTVSIGQNIAANNTDYAIEILRHGTLASPGTYSASSPAIIINDISGDGPTSLEAQGLLQINAPRIADADPNAANALLLNISNDNGSALAVNAKRNIGIGSTSPSTQLHTTGGVRFQTLTGTGNRFVITDLDGNLSAGAATTAGIITGGGTLNYVPKWTPNGTTLGNSIIFDNGTNVGIGTNLPQAKLDIVGGIRSNSSTPLDLVSIGTGTYNRTVLYHDLTYGYMLERARTTDASNGTIIDWSINQRGGGTPALIAKGNGNVGIGTASPIAALDIQASPGTIRQKGMTTMVTDLLTANTTFARRYEIARVAIDYNDWNWVGPIEIELYENYYNAGLKKKYYVYYGYVSNSGAYLSEVGGFGSNNFQVSIGSEVVVSGDIRYIPIYVDVRYYGYVTAVLKTNRTITLSNPPGGGQIWLNSSPTGSDIADFTGDSKVFMNNVSGFTSIFNYGNVGIGTATPEAKLHVEAGKIFGSKTSFPNPASYSDADLVLGSNSDTRNGYGGTNGSHIFLRSSDKSAITALDENQNLGQISYQNLVWTVGENVGWGTQTIKLPNLAGTGTRFVVTDLNGNLSAGAATTAGIIAGSGTLNYLPKWTPDGATLGNSLIFDNGTNVGIGTTNPSAKLHVPGDFKRGEVYQTTVSRSLTQNVGDYIEIGAFTNNGVGFYAEFSIYTHACGVIQMENFKFMTTSYSSGVSGSWIELPLEGSNDLYNNTQAIAIDVMNPDRTTTGSPVYARLRTKAGTCSTMGVTVIINTNVGFTPSTGSGVGGVVQPGYLGSNKWQFPVSPTAWNNTSSGLFITSNGNVGIGTTSPQKTLDVNGAFRVDAPNKITQITEHFSLFSGTISGPGNWPSCTDPAKIVTIGTITSGAYAPIEIEIYGTHRGYNNTSYFEYKKFIIMVGDVVSAIQVLSGGGQNTVNLWNGSTAGLYNNIFIGGGFDIRLQIQPVCGANFNYNYIVKYATSSFTPSATRAW